MRHNGNGRPTFVGSITDSPARSLDGPDGIDFTRLDNGNLMMVVSGNDWLHGENGFDILYPGRGYDRLFGGPGPDRVGGPAPLHMQSGPQYHDEEIDGPEVNVLSGGTFSDFL